MTSRRAYRLLLLAALLAATNLGTAQAQRPVHYPYRADMPAGMVGQGQLARGGPLPGYFQPVQLHVPPGASISAVAQGTLSPPRPGQITLGMLIGGVYQLRVTGIPGHAGAEVYPTVELVNRLYPPPGLETDFPVPIVITRQDLELALGGHFVTRVVYLENPALAMPTAQQPHDQRSFDVAADEDPLRAADELGRPMAILRLGSRVPLGLDELLARPAPPLVWLDDPQPAAVDGRNYYE